MKKTQVVCGVIRSQEGVLIARRGKGIRENIWEFPGGKVEEGESHEAAIKREIKEELELDVRVLKRIICIEDQREEEILYVHAYLCEVIQGTMKLHVHHEARVVAINEFVKYTFEPADDAILRALQEDNL